MKQIFFLILFTLLIITLQTERRHKKSHHKNGAQPCDIGSYKVTIKAKVSQEEEVSIGATLNIHYIDVEHKDVFVNGWKFDNVDTAKDTIGLFSTLQENDNHVSYIPYKHIIDFGYTNVDNLPKTLQANYQKPNNEGVILLNFEFDYDSAWDTIHESSLNKIVNWLSKARDKQLTHVINLKDKAAKLASEFFSSKSTIESLSQDKTVQEHKLTELKAHETKLKKELTKLEAEREIHRATVLMKEKELEDKKTEVSNLEDQIITENSKIYSNQNHKVQLETNLELNIASKTNYVNQKGANKKQIQNLRDSVLEECGTQKNILNDAVSHFFTNCEKTIESHAGESGCNTDIDTFSGHLITLFPTNK